MPSAPQSLEAAVLADVMEERFEDAMEKLEDFYPTELDVFADQLASVIELVDKARRGKSAR
jgi:hypothetical protein